MDVKGPSGVYTMNLPSGSIDVYCDMDIDGGGWTVFYLRQDGSETFTYSFSDYATLGIGSPSNSEFLTPLSIVAEMLSLYPENTLHI